MSGRNPVLLLLLLVGVVALAGAPAARGEGEGPAADGPGIDLSGAAAIPAKVVAGKLVISCDLSTTFRRIPVTLFVELETPCGLQLHNRAAAGIRAENRDGSANPITIHLPDLDIRVPRRELGPEAAYEEFTKYFAPEIGEVALVGTIGAHLLKGYHLVFDLHHGLLYVRPAKAASEEAAGPVDGTTTAPCTFTNDLVWFTTRFADGIPGAMALGTARYDSLIDADVCADRNAPAGDVGAVSVGGLVLTSYVALRPEEVRQVHADGVVGVTGLNLLEHFRVEVDRVNGFVRFQETAPADFPTADLAFFRARAEDDGDALQAFLETHPKSRLAKEAAYLLVEQRLSEDADAADFLRALQYVNEAQPETLRATAMLDLMEVLAEEGRPEHLLAAGRLGIESGRKDRYPNAVHKIHGRMGRLLLEEALRPGAPEDEQNAATRKEAWRHLLSAAFGMPEDGSVNLDLGRFYEASGRVRRAYSRYVQAVIQPESGAEALVGLQRLQAKLPGEERFSVDLVERLIAGKVDNFGVATKYTPSDGAPAGHVVLAEFFTNAHLESAIGGALANEGLRAHFDPAHVVVLSYHLPVPQVDPLVNELALETAAKRGVTQPTVHVFDGELKGPGAGRSDFKERIYNGLRRAALDRLPLASPFALRCEARRDGDRIHGTLVVEGPRRRGTTVQLVLAEKGVLFPGKSKVVIHRMLARGSMLSAAKGVRYKPEDGRMRIEFSRTLSEITAENERYLKLIESQGAGSVPLMSTGIDPEQATLVAYVRGATGQIVQALQVDPKADE